jgi:flagellar protein FliO/FliZ
MNIPASRAPMTLQQAPSLILSGHEATVPTAPQSVSLSAVAQSAGGETFMSETAAPVPVAEARSATAPRGANPPQPALATLHALSSATPATPATRTTASGLGDSATMLGALLLVVGLILALGKLVQKLQAARAARGGPALNVKGGLALGNRERLLWVQAGETHLLLGVSPGSVQTLHVFDRAPQAEPLAAVGESSRAAQQPEAPAQSGSDAASTPASRDFAQRLQSLLEAARARTAASTPAAPATAPLRAETVAAKTSAAEPALFSFHA